MPRPKTELNAAIEWLRETPQQEVLQEAEALLIRSRAGQQANAIAASAREALVAADYQQALQRVDEARRAYAAIGDVRQEQVLEVYAARAQRGLRANQQLDEASQLAGSFRIPQARAAADQAANEFAQLGDNQRMNEALALRGSLDNIQRIAGLALVTLG
ncbi:MAG: hypothetical protein HC893_11115, partial [Chloroflexaceae bacterium]|nr:hypothetical protein [Chloroflexaceae bacterium]